MFEREYLVAQISRFGGNISRTAEFVGMERSALHRKLKASGSPEERGNSRHQSANQRSPSCRASPMSTAAISRARAATVNIEDRGYQFADGVYEVCEVRAAASSTSAGIWSVSRARSPSCASRCRCRSPRSAWCCARRSAAIACATASSICRSRAASPAATMRFPPPGRSRASSSRRAGSISPRPKPSPRRASQSIIAARQSLGPRRHQIGVAAAERARQAGGARAGRPGGLVRR